MKSNLRKIFIIGILVICVIAINLAVFFKITEKSNNKYDNDEMKVDAITQIENFSKIFDNTIDYQQNTVNISKRYTDKEIVYTSYIEQASIENKYSLGVYIPCLNIESNVASEINEEINSLFYNKAIDILTKNNQHTIYDVMYKAYVNENILSLIISCNLKEGENPQRLIVKTYNYNLTTNEKIDISELLKYKNLTNEYVQNKINETIKSASDNVNKFNQLGYTKFSRNTKDEMYKIENTTNYFMGLDKVIYIIYAYGNLNYTSELDLVVI